MSGIHKIVGKKFVWKWLFDELSDKMRSWAIRAALPGDGTV
jgi:hypothetical protein